MSSLNKVQLIGRLGADPESRSFQNGGKVVNLRLATSETWKDKTSGERKERTEWHSVAIFNEGLASIAERFLRKGSQCFIEGQLETRKWQDQSGQDRYSTEIVLRPFNGQIVLLDGKPQQDGGQREDRTYGQDRRSSQQSMSEMRSTFAGASADLDDDVPF